MAQVTTSLAAQAIIGKGICVSRIPFWVISLRRHLLGNANGDPCSLPPFLSPPAATRMLCSMGSTGWVSHLWKPGCCVAWVVRGEPSPSPCSTFPCGFHVAGRRGWLPPWMRSALLRYFHPRQAMGLFLQSTMPPPCSCSLLPHLFTPVIRLRAM